MAGAADLEEDLALVLELDFLVVQLSRQQHAAVDGEHGVACQAVERWLAASALPITVDDGAFHPSRNYSIRCLLVYARPMSSQTVRLHRWDEIALEKVTEMLSRKIVTGEREMLAQIYVKRGCLVPMHSHESEQMTYVLQGALKFLIARRGDHRARGRGASHSLGVEHQAEALEDTFELDVFSPIRQDWLDHGRRPRSAVTPGAHLACRYNGATMAIDRQGTGLAVIRVCLGVFFLFEGLGKLRWFVNSSIARGAIRRHGTPMRRRLAEPLRILSGSRSPGPPSSRAWCRSARLAAASRSSSACGRRCFAFLAFFMVLNFHFASGAAFQVRVPDEPRMDCRCWARRWSRDWRRAVAVEIRR